MKIIYGPSVDAKIASVVLYQKFILNAGIFASDDDFIVIDNNNAASLRGIKFHKGEFICIIGIHFDVELFNQIENLIKDECNVLFIGIPPVHNSKLLTDLQQLSNSLVDGDVSLKIVCDDRYSLSVMAWVLSRYNFQDNISEILKYAPYKLTNKFEYLNLNNISENISVPWLIRFITDYVIGENNGHQIPETGYFMIGIQSIIDLPSNHDKWGSLLTNDIQSEMEVMAIMNSGIPIKDCFDRQLRDKILSLSFDVNHNGFIINDYQIDMSEFLNNWTGADFYVKFFYVDKYYQYEVYFKNTDKKFIGKVIRHYFDIDIYAEGNECMFVNNRTLSLKSEFNVFQKHGVRKNGYFKKIINSIFKK